MKHIHFPFKTYRQYFLTKYFGLSVGPETCWIRVYKLLITLRTGFVYFSEREGYKIPLIKIHNFRLFVELDKKII